MVSDIDRKADCYASGERSWMESTQRMRAIVLGPSLRMMTRAGVTPDHITIMSFVSGLAFFPIYFYSKPLALVALALHAFLDGVDGPLARHQGTASRKGSFTDTASDQVVVTTTSICLMLPTHGMIDVAAGGCFIFAYAVVVAFAMIRNAMNVPYSWLVRPRFVFYSWIVVELYLLPGSINYLIWAFNVLLGVKMISGFARIRHRI